MKPPQPITLRRRDLLLGLGTLAVTSSSGAALACHEREHPPCRAAALLPVTGPNAQTGQQAQAGIRAMGDQLVEIDPRARGHLVIVSLDSASNPQLALDAVERIMRGDIPPSAIIVTDFLPLPLLSQLGARFQVPFISILSYSSGGPSEWVFRLAPDTTQVAQGALAYFAAARLRIDQPVNLVSTSVAAPRSNEIANVITAAGRAIGVRVTLLDPNGRDIAPLAADVGRASGGSGWIVSVPAPAVPPIVALLQRSQGQGPIAIDGGLADPGPILRGANAQNLAVLSSFAPDLANRGPLARAIDARVLRIMDSPLTPTAGLAATAVQVLAHAVMAAEVRGTAYGEATRNALRSVSLPASDLIMPWAGVNFDSQTLQNRGARVVALALRENRIVTFAPA